MRALSAAMLAYMQSDGMELAMLIRLTRRDGTVRGFSTWDVDLSYDAGDGAGSVLYEASNASVGSAMHSEAGAGVDNLDVMGVLRSDRLTDVDIQAGRYDGAGLWSAYVNPRDLSMGHMAMLAGNVGELRFEAGKYVAEFRSKTQRASQQVGELTTPSCRVVALGDSRCKVAMGGTTRSGDDIRRTGTVTSVPSPQSLRMSGIIAAAGFYAYGRVQFLTGANAGVEREVKSHGTALGAVEVTVQWDGAANAVVPWSTATCGLTFHFAVPAGVWSAAFARVTLACRKLTAVDNSGVDALFLRVPTPDVEYRAGDFGENGTYDVVVSPMSAASVALINAAAGGNLTCCFRHGTPAATQYAEFKVAAAVLTLSGVPASVSDLLVLNEPLPFPAAAGDTATVEAGCDRLIGTCNSKFRDPSNSAIGNIANFRGEPYIPGMDQILLRGRGG